ncbi:hypothetical protein CDAR_200481 [Caerostris darwini]|uniref:Uncharacterized protein n=1 Tax=Caerostris darwini TaxID=1538125 RepID=A0AAV4SGI7_9ARAC|nr:hypothetical protein CDAR_200481 [Caerostris darwini]
MGQCSSSSFADNAMFNADNAVSSSSSFAVSYVSPFSPEIDQHGDYCYLLPQYLPLFHRNYWSVSLLAFLSRRHDLRNHVLCNSIVIQLCIDVGPACVLRTYIRRLREEGAKGVAPNVWL